MADLFRCKFKLQITVSLLCVTLICMTGLVRSKGVGDEDDIALSHRHQKVPLHTSTSSVKCHCKTLGEQDGTESTGNDQKNIEIQIFKSENDKKLSELQNADRRRDEDYSQSDDSKQDGPDKRNSFKSYNNAYLFGGETYPSHSTGSELLLGIMTDSFKGPRRKRRAANKDVVYVYPDNHYINTLQNTGNREIPEPSSLNQGSSHQSNSFSQTVQVQPLKDLNKAFSRRNLIQNDNSFGNHEDLKQRDILLNKAMEQAWDQYGLKSPMRKEISPTDQVQSSSNIAAIIENSFQPQGSEWDNKMTEIPVSVFHRDIPQPGFFSSLLTRYIDFEINNHEVADFGRKVMFGIMIGTFIAGWIVLGIFFGIIPLQWLIFKGRRSSGDSNGKRNAIDELSDITDRILLSLDSGWLKSLEERVKKDPRGNFVRTYAHCCILPNSQTNGMADCQLLRRSRANSTFKCLSDLIYNIEFGESFNNIVTTSPSSTTENIDEFR